MAYSISWLQNHTIRDGVYLLDTNVWIFYLKSRLPIWGAVSESNRNAPHYVQFVEELLSYDSAKIGICLCGFTELVAAYLTQAALPSYYGPVSPNAPSRPKLKTYRQDPNSDYYARLLDINTTLSEPNKFEFLHDNSFVKSFDSLREDFFLQIGMDANDYIYAIAAKSASWILVTDDADMKFPDVSILTCNNKLLPRT